MLSSKRFTEQAQEASESAAMVRRLLENRTSDAAGVEVDYRRRVSAPCLIRHPSRRQLTIPQCESL